MRLLNRNLQTVWISNYEGRFPIVDKDGNYTGEEEERFSDPLPIRASISFGSVSNSLEEYGLHESGRRILLINGNSFPFTESSRVWIYAEPYYSHNYVIERIDRSPNHISVVVQKVSVQKNG